MRLLSVEHDEDSGTVLLTMLGDEDDAIECDRLIDEEVELTLFDACGGIAPSDDQD